MSKAKRKRVCRPPLHTKVLFGKASVFARLIERKGKRRKQIKFTGADRGRTGVLEKGYILIEKIWVSGGQRIIPLE